jgi:serine/threonine protein phosphatase PrpC
MIINWKSQKGKQRHSNNDSVAIGYVDQYLLIVMVDAAEKHVNYRPVTEVDDKGRSLSQHWANSCLNELMSLGDFTDESLLVKCLENKQKELRKSFLLSIAAYGILIFNLKTMKFKWCFTGDCRLGVKNEESSIIDWLGYPHRLEESPFLASNIVSEIKVSEFKDRTKNILTQSLNARKFYQPEIINYKMHEGNVVVLATDGYWCEHLLEKKDLCQLDDDASILSISHGSQSICSLTDSPNLFVLYK